MSLNILLSHLMSFEVTPLIWACNSKIVNISEHTYKINMQGAYAIHTYYSLIVSISISLTVSVTVSVFL